MAPDAVQTQLVLRLVLGLIFLFSALAKLRAPAAFVQGVLDYHVLPAPLARIYGRLLPFVELGTALLFLSGFFLAVGAGLVVLMLVSFAIAIAINAQRGRAVACHCFGEDSASSVGWHTLVRDLVLLLPGCWLLWTTTRAALPAPLAASSIVPAIGIAVLLALSYALFVESLELVIGATRRIALR